MATDAEILDEVRRIVSDPEMRRTRVRRDAIAQIQELVGVTEPVEPGAAEADAEGSQEPVEVSRPPVNGPGSSAAAWKDYAAVVGIEISPTATKAEIIALVDAAEADAEGVTETEEV